MAAVLDITEVAVLTVLRAFISNLLPLLPDGVTPLPVIRGLSNRVSTPVSDFIACTPSGQRRLATNVTPEIVYDPAPTALGHQNTVEYTVQVDCYGVNACDWAVVISTMLRSGYAVGQFETLANGALITPLYADDPKQLPIVDGEAQYEERWMVMAVIQYNPTITLPEQFASELGPVDIIDVDVKFPPD